MPPSFPQYRCHVSPPHRSDRLASLPTWQAAIGCGATLFVVLPVLFLPETIAESLPTTDSAQATILAGLIGTVGAIGGFIVFARCLGISPKSMFLRWPSRQVLGAAGMMLALITALVIGTILLVPGEFILHGDTWQGIFRALVVAGAIGLWTGTIEELFLRGAILSIIGNQWNWFGAVIVTAILFGLLHTGAGTTDLHTTMYVILTTLAGVLFGLVTVLTGNVWNAVAMHATWNAVFSGYLLTLAPTTDTVPLLWYRLTDSHWLVTPVRASVTESPLAIALLTIALIASLTYVSIPSSQ